MIWQQLQTPQVRDLAWACFSPPLLLSGRVPCGEPAAANCEFHLTPQRCASLEKLDRNPEPLLNHLANYRQQRLGLYFEALWHFFLQTDAETDLLAHNLPVRVAGETMGEFDILYRCRQSGRQFHLELAVKFYLGVPDTNIWLGPSQRDRLDNKITQLGARQIQLGARAEAKPLLQKLGIERLERQIEIKGYLFHPVAASTRLPAAHNPAQPESYWYSLDSLPQMNSTGTALPGWQHVPRSRWLAPLFLADRLTAEDENTLQAKLQQRFETGRGPQILAYCDEEGCELFRCMVAPNCWPNTSADHA
jgi:hypothetical protein